LSQILTCADDRHHLNALNWTLILKPSKLKAYGLLNLHRSRTRTEIWWRSETGDLFGLNWSFGGIWFRLLLVFQLKVFFVVSRLVLHMVNFTLFRDFTHKKLKVEFEIFFFGNLVPFEKLIDPGVDPTKLFFLRFFYFWR